MHARRCTLLTVALTLTAGAATGPFAVAADEATKTPDDILADVARDFARVTSYHFEVTQTDASGHANLVGDALASGAARLTLRTGPETVTILTLRKASYLRGNATFLRREMGAPRAAARRLAGRWMKLPAGSGPSQGDGYAPARLAACLITGHGTITNEGVRTVAGQQVVALVDHGDQPGTSPGEIDVAASGRALPVRLTQTGKRQPGKAQNACDDEHDTTTAAELRFSAYNKPLRLNAPRHAPALPLWT